MSINIKVSSLILVFFITTHFAQAQNPNWSEDAACIIYSHCTSCHNPNGAGPMSLLTYNEVKSNATSISYYVSNELMPPWPVDNDYSAISHARNLSADEKTTLLKWIKDGLELGDSTKAPTKPIYSSKEVITSPDLVLKAPK